MTREELKALGLTDEQIDKVMASHGKAINETKEKADKVEDLEKQIEDYKEQIKTRDGQLEELEGKADGNKDLLDQIEKLKTDNKTATEELQAKLDEQAFNFALDKSLSGAKVRNTKAAKALLDLEKIKLDGETLLGLDDQLKAVKESDPYLFEEEKKDPNSPQIVKPGNPDGGDNNSDNDPFAVKLAKYD